MPAISSVVLLFQQHMFCKCKVRLALCLRFNRPALAAFLQGALLTVICMSESLSQLAEWRVCVQISMQSVPWFFGFPYQMSSSVLRCWYLRSQRVKLFVHKQWNEIKLSEQVRKAKEVIYFGCLRYTIMYIALKVWLTLFYSLSMLIAILMVCIICSRPLPPLGRSSSRRWPADRLLRSSRQVSFHFAQGQVWTDLSVKHQLVWQHSPSVVFIALLNT